MKPRRTRRHCSTRRRAPSTSRARLAAVRWRWRAQVSSSSSEPDGVQGLLGRSLHAIRDSVPSQYAAIVTALQHDVVQLQVDHETFSIHAQPDGLALAGAESSAAVRLITKSCTITALIDGT